MSKAQERRNAVEAINNITVPGNDDVSLSAHTKHKFYTVVDDMVFSCQAMGGGCEGLVIVSYGPVEVRVSYRNLQPVVDKVFELVEVIDPGS